MRSASPSAARSTPLRYRLKFMTSLAAPWIVTVLDIGFKEQDFKKLGAVCQMAKPECAANLLQLAENLDQFDFAPGVHTPEEYGRYMIQKSGHFEYDENLDEFYNYGEYGVQRMLQEDGVFVDRGYVSYHGTLPLEELMQDDPAESYQQEQEAKMEGMTW